MKKILLLSITLFIGFFSANAQTTAWNYDVSHTKIGFTVGHFGISETDGKFTKFTGQVMADKPDFSDAKINLKIEVSSVFTDDVKRDEHLRSADYFDAAKYPDITFVSKSFKSVGKNKYLLTGDLTIKKVTKSVSLNVVYRGTVPKDPWGNTKAGFSLTGLINRQDFGLNWTGKLESGDLLVADEVNLIMNLELNKVK